MRSKIQYIDLEKNDERWRFLIFLDCFAWCIFLTCILPKNTNEILLYFCLFLTILPAFLNLVQKISTKILITIRCIIDNIFQLLIIFLIDENLKVYFLTSYYVLTITSTIINVMVCKSRILKVYLYVVGIIPILFIIQHYSQNILVILYTCVFSLYLSMILVNTYFNLENNINEELNNVREKYELVYEKFNTIFSSINFDYFIQHVKNKHLDSTEIINIINKDMVFFNKVVKTLSTSFPFICFYGEEYINNNNINTYNFLFPFFFTLNEVEIGTINVKDNNIILKSVKSIEEIDIEEIQYMFNKLHILHYYYTHDKGTTIVINF